MFLSRLKTVCGSACYMLPVLIVIVLAWGLAERSVRHDRQSGFESNIKTGREMAAFLSREVREAIRYGDNYALALRRAYVEGNRSVAAVNRLIEVMPYDVEKISHVTLLDAEGKPLLNSIGPLVPGVSAADRDYFRFVRDHEGDPVYVSEPLKGRVSGKTILRVVRRITLTDGSFGGAIFAAIEVQHIENLFKLMGSASSAAPAFMLLGTDRILRASSRPDTAPLMDSFDKAGLWQAVEKSEQGVLLFQESSAGVTRFHGFHHLAGYPLVAVSSFASIDITEGLAQYNKRPYRMAFVATLVVLILVFAFRRLVQTKNRLKVDVIARHKAESVAEEKSALLQAVFDNMAQGLLVYDPDERLAAFNDKYVEITGLPKNFLELGMDRDVVNRFRAERGDFGPGDVEQHLREVRESAADGEARRVERISSNGSPHIHMRNMMPDGGRVITVTDITDRLEVEKQLRQAQKMEAVGQLTGGVAHDFNNLLGVTLGNVELAEIATRDGDDVRSFLAGIKRATERGASLTSQLLAFSRQQTLFPKVVDLGDLVRGTSGLLHTALGATVEVDIRSEADIWSCEVDPGLLENATLNLALNARDAMPNGGKLTIQTGNITVDDDYVGAPEELLPGDYVVVVVTDSGTGMGKEETARVFEPFFTTKDVGKGSGLGLSMVYGFVKQSGGHVTIYSEEGVGTSVRMYLPRFDKGVRPAEPADHEEAPKARGECILILEDDPDLRCLAEDMLITLGYRVITAAAAAAAAEVMRREAVDLILSDVVLPGGTSGPEFIAQARASRPGLKVIFMSGYPAEAMYGGKSLGGEDVLIQKPFKLHALAQALHKAINTKGHQ